MRGHDAFDELVKEGFMEVNPDTGWGEITRIPDNKKDLDWLVYMVKILGAWSVGTSTGEKIEVTRGSGPNTILFKKIRSK